MNAERPPKTIRLPVKQPAPGLWAAGDTLIPPKHMPRVYGEGRPPIGSAGHFRPINALAARVLRSDTSFKE